MSVAESEDIEPIHERIPVVFLLDTSGSMAGEKIKQLNEGLRIFKEDLDETAYASRNVDISLIEFGGKVETIQEFTSIQSWTPPRLTAGGHTPMGSAIIKAVDAIEKQQLYYQNNDIPYSRATIFLLTDGNPTDMSEGSERWVKVQELLERGKQEGHFDLFAVAMSSVNVGLLNELVGYSSEKNVYRIDDFDLIDLFPRLSNSVRKASDPNSGETWENVKSNLAEIGDRLESTPLTLKQLPKKDPEAHFYYFTDSTYTTEQSRFKQLDDRLTLLARHRVGLDVTIVDRDRGVSPEEWELLVDGLDIENYPALVVANEELGVEHVGPFIDSFSPSDIEYATLENGIIADQILEDSDEINDFLNALFDCASSNDIESGMRKEKIVQGLKIGKKEISNLIHIPVR